MVLDRFKKSRISVWLYCASNRNPEWGTSTSVRDSVFHAAQNGIDCKMMISQGESLISRARQNALVHFMQGSYEFMFSFDDDVTLPLDTIRTLVKADKDIVGVIYRLKKEEIATAVRLPKGGPRMNQVLESDLLTPAIHISTGCFMVKKATVKKMIDHYKDLWYNRNVTGDICWALYMPYIHNGEYLSEDWAFCQRARDIGLEVWVHGGVKCGHWGKRLYAY